MRLLFAIAALVTLYRYDNADGAIVFALLAIAYAFDGPSWVGREWRDALRRHSADG